MLPSPFNLIVQIYFLQISVSLSLFKDMGKASSVIMSYSRIRVARISNISVATQTSRKELSSLPRRIALNSIPDSRFHSAKFHGLRSIPDYPSHHTQHTGTAAIHTSVSQWNAGSRQRIVSRTIQFPGRLLHVVRSLQKPEEIEIRSIRFT
jgi:hypothetical protein